MYVSSSINFASQTPETKQKKSNGKRSLSYVDASVAQELKYIICTLFQGAHLVLIGLHRKAFQVDDYLNDIVFKSLTMHTVHGRRIFDTWEKCETLIADGKVKPTMIVSHEFKMTEHQKAFDVLMSGDACKIVVDPKS